MAVQLARTLVTTTSQAISGGAGVLHVVVVANDSAGDAVTVALYDGTSATGDPMFKAVVTSKATFRYSFNPDWLPFPSGVYVSISGTAEVYIYTSGV